MPDSSHEQELSALRARVAALEDAERRARDAERERDRTYALYRATVERTPIGLGIADEQGEFLVWNAALMAVSGFAPSEPERWNEHRQSEAARASRKRLLEVVWREGFLAHELTIPRSDGTSCEAAFTVQPALLEGERCVHVTLQDVTELRRVEQALRESELRFRQVAETIRQVFYITTPDHSKVLYVSPAYEQIWGRTCASLYESPLSWVQAIHPEDRDRMAARAAEGPVEGQYDLEYRIVRPDGSERWISDRAFVLANESGEIYRLVGSAEDVTERRRLEEQLREAQKMEALGQLAGGVAHDFNNMLTAILCNVALVRKSLADGAPQRERLDDVRVAAERAAGLTKKLLGFSRRAMLSLQPIDLRAAARETATMLRHTLDPRIRLIVDEADEPATVLADAVEMAQVLLNLCLNARDAMPEGGALTLRTRTCSVTDEQARRTVDARAGEAVCLSVEDTGHGIPPELQRRIFEPFFTTKEPGAGTGLGLAMVFGIVKQHGGWMEFSTDVGRGTRFDVYLPRDRGAITAARTSSQPPPRSVRGETILFVDDEPALRRIADSILSDAGYHVLLAGDGASALEVFEREWRSIDLVILDLRMPQLSGRDALHAMLRIHPDVRVVVSSGHAADHERLQQTERTAGSLSKPYTVDELVRAVRTALGESSEARASLRNS